MVAHVGPQLMPPSLEVTVPVPVPPLLTVRVKPCCALKTAVTDFDPLPSITVQVAPETPSQPLQPPKTEPWLGVAVRVAVVPPG